MKTISFLFSILFFLVTSPVFSETTRIGTIKTAKGSVIVIRGDDQQSGGIGFQVFQKDLIRTGNDGGVGVVFIDNTVLSLGPDTELVIEEYVFVPQKNWLSMIVRMIKGTASYLSGIIGKQSPENVKFKTPQAIIGIRGTKFLVKVD